MRYDAESVSENVSENVSVGMLQPRMNWADRTSTEIAAGAPATCIFPVGAIEQHGPHLPLATDLLIPERVAKVVAERTGAALLPTLPFGARSRANSGGGERFPGGLAVEPEPLMAIVRGVVADAARSGAWRVVVLSWHYENAGFLWEACRRAADDVPGAMVLLVDSPGDLMPAHLLAEKYPGGAFPGWVAEHAATIETSLILHLAPELIRTDEIPSAAPEQPVVDPWHVLPDRLTRIPANGVFAAAQLASAEYGRLLFEGLCDGLAAVISHGPEARALA